MGDYQENLLALAVAQEYKTGQTFLGLPEAFHQLELAADGPCSLGHGGKNWVTDEGGLPNYICHIAKALIKSGHDESSAIAIAVSRAKVWATGKGVSPEVQAKASAAVAQWEKKKAGAKAKPNKDD